MSLQWPEHQTHFQRRIAFSLVEVVMSLAICSFGLVAIMGLFTTGLKCNRESESCLHAANLVVKLVEMRRLGPTNTVGTAASLAIPPLSQPFGKAYNNGAAMTSYITATGYITNNAAGAAYLASCQAGTNSQMGSHVAQIYLMLSWPPQLDPSNPQSSHHEILTYIRVP